MQWWLNYARQLPRFLLTSTTNGFSLCVVGCMRQVNLEVEVRFGMSLKQGHRYSMEDTASYVADVFNADIIAPGSNSHAGLPVPPGAVTAAPPADHPSKADAGAYFGVFDGANNLS